MIEQQKELKIPYTDVLTMERISGVPISDIDTLKARGTNIKRLAHNGVEIFFTQVFEHNFFHADMHPGNLFVAEDGTIIAMDFGIMTAKIDEIGYITHAENLGYDFCWSTDSPSQVIF